LRIGVGIGYCRRGAVDNDLMLDVETCHAVVEVVSERSSGRYENFVATVLGSKGNEKARPCTLNVAFASE
jgi:hypothetical protein